MSIYIENRESHKGSKPDRSCCADPLRNLPAAVESRVRDALFGSRPITAAARSVLTVLVQRECFGRHRPIRGAELRAILLPTLSERETKAAIAELAIAGVPVGSARSRNASGYFIVTCDEDVRAAVAPLIGEIKSLATRVRRMSPDAQLVRRLIGQATFGEAFESEVG